jgi:UPF0271 protein
LNNLHHRQHHHLKICVHLRPSAVQLLYNSMLTIDLNADLGEGDDQDDILMSLISSCNIACGGHAGNDETMRRAVYAALAAGVAIGAHPGYEDPEHFGRRNLTLSASEVRSQILRQIERLLAIIPNIHHVKPHGALYHQANHDPHLAATVCDAIQELLPGTLLYAPPFGELGIAATTAGINHCAEGFIDRGYLPDGSLCPRSTPSAIIETPNEAAAQALQIARYQQVATITGQTIPLPARTLCIHSDNPNALGILEAVRHQFQANRIAIKPLQR